MERLMAKPGPTKELTDNPQEAAKTWPDTTWHGHKVIDILAKLVIDQLEPMLEEKGYTFQEVYLAYLDPFNSGDEDNGFIVGWDIWTDKGFTSAYCQFEVLINEYDGSLSIKTPLDGFEAIEGIHKCSGFYNHINGARKLLHEEWGGLVELRLD